jgi:hypothetical protein
LALIAMIAFGAWYIRFQKRKEARKTGDGQSLGRNGSTAGAGTTVADDQASTYQFNSDPKFSPGGYVPMNDYPPSTTQPSPKTAAAEGVVSPMTTNGNYNTVMAEAPNEPSKRVEAPDQNFYRVEAPEENFQRAELSAENYHRSELN